MISERDEEVSFGAAKRTTRCTMLSRDFMAAAGIETGSRLPLFQSAAGNALTLSGLPMHRTDVGAMVKRRCKAAGLSASICPHSSAPPASPSIT